MGYILPEDGSIMYTLKSPGSHFFGFPLVRDPDNEEIKFHQGIFYVKPVGKDKCLMKAIFKKDLRV